MWILLKALEIRCPGFDSIVKLSFHFNLNLLKTNINLAEVKSV